MNHDQGSVKPDNFWSRFAWWFTAAVVGVLFVLGFVVLSQYQQNGPKLDFLSAICRAIGITGDRPLAGTPQPPIRTPTRIAWTGSTLAQIESGSASNGAQVAVNCAACHGEGGVSASPMFPTLAGMDATVIYKQLDDFRSEKRASAFMGAIAKALSAQDSANAAAYFASKPGGLAPVTGEGIPEGGHSLRQSDPVIRLVFAGDPVRDIPPCSACHGPDGHKIGAPALRGQHAEYIEGQLAAFAQGIRQNDINQQMRIIAGQLTTDEMHAIALYYAGPSQARTAGKQ
jgi:cytochrome c553